MNRCVIIQYRIPVLRVWVIVKLKIQYIYFLFHFTVIFSLEDPLIIRTLRDVLVYYFLVETRLLVGYAIHSGIQ